MVSFGLRSGGGIGDQVLYPNESQNPSQFIYRTIFDFAFFTVVIMILLSIVKAMIIDSFSELREERETKGKFDKG
jgi:hypothetical protein